MAVQKKRDPGSGPIDTSNRRGTRRGMRPHRRARSRAPGPRKDRAPQIVRVRTSLKLTLGDLTETLAALMPNRQVSSTITRLFARGLAHFDRAQPLHPSPRHPFDP